MYEGADNAATQGAKSETNGSTGKKGKSRGGDDEDGDSGGYILLPSAPMVLSRKL